jgi:hypothetical protein
MALYGFTPNTKIESAKVNANNTNFSDHARWVSLEWLFGGSLTTQTSKDYKDLPDDVTWERCDLMVDGAPAGAAIIVDIERSTDNGANWVTIFTGGTNRPQIAAGAKVGNTTVIDIPTAAGNSYRYRAKVAQVGSSTPGNDLTITLKGKYDLD